jgi:hypothetical protein
MVGLAMGKPHSLVPAGWIVADLAQTVEIAIAAALLAVAIGLGIAVFTWARKWRQALADDSDREASIETYREMLDEGLIDPQEFERIQARLDERPDAPSAELRSGPPAQPTDRRPGPPPTNLPSEPTPE